MYRLICLAMAWLLSGFITDVRAQRQLSGEVIDAVSKVPIASANVYLANSSVGTVTDEKGKFRITNFPAGRYDLVVSCIGYSPQSISLNTSQLPASLSVALKPKVEELQEVVVEPYEKNGWEKWGQFFMDNFIGTHAFAKSCSFRNSKIVKFRFSKKKNTLEAFADDQLVIENKALGYLLKFDLVSFEYNFSTHILIYRGYPFFTELPTKRERLKKRWERNRQEVYEGSVMHFMRSLYRNRLLENHFEVRRLIKISPEEKARVRSIYLGRMTGNNAGARNGQGIGSTPRPDSMNYYRMVLNQPESLNILVNTLLPGDSIAYGIDSTTAGLRFPGYLQVVYPSRKTPPEYKPYLPKGVEYTLQTSEIYMRTDEPIAVLANGSYFPPVDLITVGYWGWSEKICTLLPSDYKTSNASP
jgi:hypothetical protein